MFKHESNSTKIKVRTWVRFTHFVVLITRFDIWTNQQSLLEDLTNECSSIVQECCRKSSRLTWYCISVSAWPYEQLIVYWSLVSWTLPLSLPSLTSLLTPEAVLASHWSGLTWSRALIGWHQVTPDRRENTARSHRAESERRREEGDKRIFLLHT